MATRFNQKVSLQTQNLASGADSGLMALSGKFQQIAQKNLASREQSIIEDQTLAGQQSFEKGVKPKFMDEDRIVGGVSAKAYNKGLMAAYSASISNDIREDLANIELSNPDDVTEYKAQVAANRNALAKSVDPAALPEVLARFDEHTTSGSIRVQQRGETKTRAETKQILGDNIKSLGDESARLARLGDTNASRNGLIELSKHLDAAVAAETITAVDAKVELAKYQQEAMEQESRHIFDGMVKTPEGLENAFSKLSDMEDKPPKGWTPDKWDGYISSQRSELMRSLNGFEAKAKEGLKLQKKLAEFDDIEKRLKGDDSVIIAPKVANDYYLEKVVPLTDGLNPQQAQAVTANYVDKIKHMPSSMKAQIENNINSGNSDLIIDSAQFLDRIDEMPGVVDQISANERAFASNVVILSQNLSPEEAVKLAKQATDPRDSARIEAVEQAIKLQFKNTDKQAAYNDQAFEAFTSFFSSSPDIDASSLALMGKEYGALYEAKRKAGMDDAEAQKQSRAAIKRNWGNDDSLGKERIMKYPPKNYYSVNGDTSWIKGQLNKDIENEVFGLPVEDVLLLSNDNTARMASTGQPSYAVAVMVNGAYEVIMDDNGNPKSWMPDMAAEETRISDMNVAEALAYRKRLLERNLTKTPQLSAF